jgi:hypothetical protein
MNPNFKAFIIVTYVKVTSNFAEYLFHGSSSPSTGTEQWFHVSLNFTAEYEDQ